jgi:hypothetical protein
MEKNIFDDKNNLICKIIYPDYELSNKFYTEDSLPIQVASFNKDSGDVIENHIHLKNKRIVEETGEIIIVQKGKIEVKIFDSEKNLLATEILNNNCIACFYGGGHGFKMLTDTLFLEIKQGPYNEKLDKEKFHD